MGVDLTVLRGTPAYVAGKYGQAAKGAVYQLPVALPAQWRIEFWYNATAHGPGGQNLCLARQSTYTWIGVLNGQATTAIGSAIASNFSPDLDDGSWHHLSFNQLAGSIAVYVDGIQVGTRGDILDFSSNSGPNAIGGYHPATDLDSVASLCDFVASSSPRSGNFTPPAGPPASDANTLAIYRFNGNLSDSAGVQPATPAITGVAISPTNPTVPGGTTRQFTLTATYSDGTTAPAPSPAFTSTLGPITPSGGLYTAPASTPSGQSSTVSGSAGGYTATTTVTIPAVALPAIGAISITSDSGYDTVTFPAPTAGTYPVARVWLYASTTSGGTASVARSRATAAGGTFTLPSSGAYYTVKASDDRNPANFSAASNEVAGAASSDDSAPATNGSIQAKFDQFALLIDSRLRDNPVPSYLQGFLGYPDLLADFARLVGLELGEYDDEGTDPVDELTGRIVDGLTPGIGDAVADAVGSGVGLSDAALAAVGSRVWSAPGRTITAFGFSVNLAPGGLDQVSIDGVNARQALAIVYADAAGAITGPGAETGTGNFTVTVGGSVRMTGTMAKDARTAVAVQPPV